MSPEHVRGKTLDRRTDIWAFGCMFYEAITGKPPFASETVSDTLAAVLREEPDWRGLSHAPMAVQRLIKRCLKKDPTARLHDIADAGLEIEDAVAESAPLVVQMPGVDPWRVSRKRAAVTAAVALSTLAALVALGLWLAGRPTAPVSESVSRVVLTVPAGQQVERGGPLAISRDGARLVYVAVQGEGRTQLFMRPLDRFGPTALAGTEGASAPFFSPDGKWVGFYSNGAMQRVSIDGGGALKICETPAVWSATWGDDDTIVFATSATPGGLWRVTGQRCDARTPDDRGCRGGRAAARLPAASPERRGPLRRHDRSRLAPRGPLDRGQEGAPARPAWQWRRRRAVRAADRPSALCECRRARGRAVRPDVREAPRIADAAPRAPGGRPLGERGVRGIRIGDARLHSARVDVALARTGLGGQHRTVESPVRHAGRVLRIPGCRPTVGASPSPSHRRTAPTSGSTTSSVARRRRS